MLQLGYSNLYIDPETAVGMEDPGWFGAAYYAITCADYGSGQGTPEERAARIIDEARAFAPRPLGFCGPTPWNGSPAPFGPIRAPDNRPAPYAGGDWPTLVLNGTGDPITPMPMAYSTSSTTPATPMASSWKAARM
jgi:hypothetical protein